MVLFSNLFTKAGKGYAFFVLFSIITLLIPSYATAQASAFPDVPENTTHYGAVSYLKSKGIIGGYPDGTFKPGNDINRAEALKIVLLASGFSIADGGNENFSDVNPSDWFSPYVVKGVSENIVKGYDDGTFRPATNINVAESLKIILLSFGVDVGSPPTQNPFPDVDTMAWYSNFANYAKEKQFIWTLDDGKLHADRNITRGEFVQIIYRLMFTQENNLEEFPLSRDWPLYIDPNFDFKVKYPFNWKQITADNQIIFWKKDTLNNQLSWIRAYPNSATVIIAMDDNKAGLSLEKYLETIEYDSSAIMQKLVLNGYPFASINVSSVGINDYYFELPNNKILVAYTQVGDGLNRNTLLEEIRHLVGSIRYEEGIGDSVAKAGTSVAGGGNSSLLMSAGNKDVFLSEVRKQILVAGKSLQVIEAFPGSLLVIETDTIGIGTGPVDYYYNGEYDVTLKVERGSNTLLGLNDGRNTAF